MALVMSLMTTGLMSYLSGASKAVIRLQEVNIITIDIPPAKSVREFFFMAYFLSALYLWGIRAGQGLL